MQEFKHSVKVPRNYKLAASILKRAVTEGASVKSLLYEDKLKHYRTNVLYALISEAIKHNAEIDKLFESTEILKNEPRLDPWLAKVLTVELLYGKKTLPGKSKPELTIVSYKEKFEQHDVANTANTAKDFRRPRYVRINTNLLTTSDAIREFQDEGYRFIRCTSGSYNDFLEQVKRLEKYDFMQDYHVKMMFVFAPGTKLHEHPLYLEHKIILHDKATALAVHLLAPPPGSVVIDLCAAPGMKTTQLAAYLRNQGTVYAVERSIERYQVLCDLVQQTGSTCVRTLHKDSFDIRRGDYPDVEYVLLDPSCSGSGMDLSAHSYMDGARLSRLSSWQEKFLKHAMNAFPNVKRVIYSTCSVFPQENERVVTNVVSQSRQKWHVLNVKELLKDQWNNFGTGMYGSMGTRCLYARPESDLTTGFFLAVLEKDKKYYSDNTNVKTKNDAVRGEPISQDDLNDNSNENISVDGKAKKIKKRKGTDIEISANGNETPDNHETCNDTIQHICNVLNGAGKLKKKKKMEAEESSTVINVSSDENRISVNDHIDLKYKKKKKKKRGQIEKEFPDEGISSTNISINGNGTLENLGSFDDTTGAGKRKKNKMEVMESSGVINVSSDENGMNDGIELKYKKNKKKKKRDHIEKEFSNEGTEESMTKKDKKRKSSAMSEDSIECYHGIVLGDVDTDVKIKKPKKKYLEDTGTQDCDVKVKKDNRKLQKYSEVILEHSNDISEEFGNKLNENEKGTSNKMKKKRNKNKDMSVLILDSAQSEFETHSKKIKYADTTNVAVKQKKKKNKEKHKLI